MKPIRVYADTSVFGGVFDDEFALPSRRFFQQAQEGRFRVVFAALVRYELGPAPEQVRRFFNEMADTHEIHETPEKAILLRDLYLRAGIVGEKSLADALHVAHATVLNCKLIVSWNFRHIVHFQKIPLYNEVNRREGYSEIAIHTPQEVIGYEKETL